MTTLYQEKARDQESEEALEQRLARVIARRRQHLALETAEERLSRRRVRLTDRRSAEMAEERETQVRLNLQVNATTLTTLFQSSFTFVLGISPSLNGWRTLMSRVLTDCSCTHLIGAFPATLHFAASDSSPCDSLNCRVISRVGLCHRQKQN